MITMMIIITTMIVKITMMIIQPIMLILLIVYFMKLIRFFYIENDCDMCNDNNVGGDSTYDAGVALVIMIMRM